MRRIIRAWRAVPGAHDAGMSTTRSLDGDWLLGGSDWQRGIRPSDARQEGADERLFLPARVPGEVHLDLMRAGLIADVDRGLGVLAARWVEEQMWTYRRWFEVPAEALAARRVWLHCAGIDHTAVICINGAEVGRHAGSFTPARLDVTGKLRPGRNLITIEVESGLYDAAERPTTGYGNLDLRITKRNWLRKPQCQFGWDWSPRLVNVGLPGSVTLEWTAARVRADQLVPVADVDADLATGRLRVRWHAEALEQGVPVSLRISLPEAGVASESAAVLAPGLQAIEATLAVPRPRLWWPVGHGRPERYRLVAELVADGAVVARREVMVGFRRVEMDQSPHPEGGRFCILRINNRPIFCKGGNFVPADIITARLDRARYATLVDRALEQHFNLLRVWGGGLYESGDFYELCDERGVLVWQEFIFACAKYPGTDQGFYDLVRDEARFQVRRLASHPSLVAWCGNNEIEQGYFSWGFDRGQVLPDHQIYHHLLPRIVGDEDGSRWWQPSSPFSPDPTVAANDDLQGDQHPWSIGFHDTDFRKYRSMPCRFPNEGGILGPNALPTVLECLPEGQREVGSFAWMQHDNAVSFWGPATGAPERMVADWTGKELRGLPVAEAVYWMGLVHGEGLREYIDNFRRRMFSSAAAVFWMYNDTWPCTRSWTTVDCRLRRTPAFQPVRRAFAPLSVVVVESGDRVEVHGVNDGPEAVAATLRFGLFGVAGGLPLDRSAEVVVPANAAAVLAWFPRAAWRDPAGEVAFAMLSDGAGRLLARNRLILPRFRELRWARPEVAVLCAGGRAEFTAPVFAWGVCLDLDGETPLGDNFFDVWPGIPYAIPWAGASAPRILHVGNLG